MDVTYYCPPTMFDWVVDLGLAAMLALVSVWLLLHVVRLIFLIRKGV